MILNIDDAKHLTAFTKCPICGDSFSRREIHENESPYKRRFLDFTCKNVFKSYDGNITRAFHYGATIFPYTEDYIIYRRILVDNRVCTIKTSSLSRALESVFYMEDTVLHNEENGRSYHRLVDSDLYFKFKMLMKHIEN